jgi:uncharacterized protein YbjT (DUF2867 family)
MNITVLGASGGSGQAITAELALRGQRQRMRRDDGAGCRHSPV